MEKLTYRQAYDKIIDAYFKDEIKPMDAEFCFCGTLCNNSEWFNDKWCNVPIRINKTIEHFNHSGYTGLEFGRMENALLRSVVGTYSSEPEYEEKLFSGMTAALEVLKQIHRDRGEDVDEVPRLRKRDLARSL